MQTTLPVIRRLLRTVLSFHAFSKQNSSISKQFAVRFLTSEPVLPKSTIDSDEAVKFRQFASVWWDQYGSLKPLHAMNRLRVPLIRDSLCPPHETSAPRDSKLTGDFAPLTGFSILDVGCGGGILAEPLAYLGAQVLGIDQVSESINVATAHVQLTADRWKRTGRDPPRYETIGLDAVAVRYPSHFDAVIMSELLEHVTDWESMLCLANVCLKPGGMLFITTLNQTRTSFLLGVVAAEYVLGIVPRGTHDWYKFIEPSRLQGALIRNGFRPHQLLGLTYNILTNQWSWTSNLCVNYAVTAVKTDDEKLKPSPPEKSGPNEQ
ncbi:Ubiquinone biosynthesis O-methyltransferase [Fasciola hepatica]|uniref:Ubiquinone biosynthesis O-methyltransferase, mitochondrial n=1 Tax=Fasciola hepatica TaxID=6192 RepID=A0A4E0RKR8_FASHE|nr:Ubiquinone biosynthesis O-methyltransferase [Fasciola hepatica]